jgi:O-antigen/teichoic acid export membrane protein
MVLLQTWLSLFDFGLTPALAREMARFTAGAHDGSAIRGLLRAVELPVFAVAILIAGGIWIASGWLAIGWLRADSLHAPEVAAALGLIGLVVAFRVIENLYRGGLIGLQHQVTVNVVTGLMATVRVAGAAAVLVFVSPSVIAFFVWQALIGGATAAIFAVAIYRALPAGIRSTTFLLEPLGGIWKFATGTLLVTALGFVLSQTDKVILSTLVTLSAFGVYSLAYTVASAVRQLAIPFDQAVFPRLIQLHEIGDGLGLSDLYHRAMQYKVVVMGGVGVFITVFGSEILRIWIHEPGVAAQASSILWILVVGMVLNGLMSGPYYLQMAAGWTGLLVKTNAVLAILFLPTVYLLTQSYYLVGAATAWLLLNVVYVLTVGTLMHRRLLRGEFGEWFAVDVLAPLGASAAVALGLRALAPHQAGNVETIAFSAVALPAVLLAAAVAANRVRHEAYARLRVAFARAS